jgi:Ca-activated chloride channel family protein
MKRTEQILLVVMLMCWANMAQAQEKKYIREGNKLYYEGKLPEAQKQYEQALTKNNKSTEAVFNTGNVYLKSDSLDKAVKQFETAATVTTDPKVKSKAYHNMGNALLQQQKFEEAVGAYKNALKNNPTDADTKYNLAYAMSKVKQEQQRKDKKQDQKDKNEDQQNKDQKQNQTGDNKKQDNKGQQNDKPKDPKEGKNGENQDAKQGDSKDPKDQNVKPKEGQLSKDQAQRLLDALKNEEQKVQQRLQEKKAPPRQKTNKDKDW